MKKYNFFIVLLLVIGVLVGCQNLTEPEIVIPLPEKKIEVNLTGPSNPVIPGKIKLTWNSIGADYCTSPDFNTNYATSGTVEIEAPSSTKIFSVTAKGKSGEKTSTAIVKVAEIGDTISSDGWRLLTLNPLQIFKVVPGFHNLEKAKKIADSLEASLQNIKFFVEMIFPNKEKFGLVGIEQLYWTNQYRDGYPVAINLKYSPDQPGWDATSGTHFIHRVLVTKKL